MIKTNSSNFIKRLQRGKEDALEWTYDRYIPFVKSIVCNVLKQFNDNGIIEECINDVFIAIWNNAHKFKGDEQKFKNWIGAIAKFKAIDCYRKMIKNSAEILDEINIVDRNLVEDELLIMENKKEVMSLLNELDKVDKEIFIMKYFMDMSAEEIGQKLNLTKSAVDSKVYRAKRKLREKAVKFKLEVI